MLLQDALAFLRDHQPLPDKPTPLINQLFDQALCTLFEQQTPEAVPLLIGSCANWDSDGNFEQLEYLVSQYPVEQVREHVIEGLRSPHYAVRHWSAVIAARFALAEFLPGLAALLEEPVDVQRMVAAYALERIGTAEARELAQHRIPLETSEHVREILEAVEITPPPKEVA